jgi:hypothetical protein
MLDLSDIGVILFIVVIMYNVMRGAVLGVSRHLGGVLVVDFQLDMCRPSLKTLPKDLKKGNAAL